jgi:hypothetical protein
VQRLREPIAFVRLACGFGDGRVAWLLDSWLAQRCGGWWVRDVAVGRAVHMPEDGAVPLPPAPPSPGRRWWGWGAGGWLCGDVVARALSYGSCCRGRLGDVVPRAGGE